MRVERCDMGISFADELVAVGGSGGVTPGFVATRPRAGGEVTREVEDEADLLDRGLPRGRRQRVEIVLERVENRIGGAFPGRDLMLDGGAEEVALRDAVHG